MKNSHVLRRPSRPKKITRITTEPQCLVLTDEHGTRIRYVMEDPRLAAAALRIALKPVRQSAFQSTETREDGDLDRDG